MRFHPITAALLFSTLLAFAKEGPAAPKTPPADKFVTRCGWLDNPTPGNLSLYDRDDEWVIGVQGGHQVEGDWEMPDFTPRQWVGTNAGSYGYGCACLQLKADAGTHEVSAVKSARALPLETCRRDKSLERWKDMFR